MTGEVWVLDRGALFERCPSMMVAVRRLLEGYPFAEIVDRFVLLDDGVRWCPVLVDDLAGVRVEWRRDVG